MTHYNTCHDVRPSYHWCQTSVAVGKSWHVKIIDNRFVSISITGTRTISTYNAIWHIGCQDINIITRPDVTFFSLAWIMKRAEKVHVQCCPIYHDCWSCHQHFSCYRKGSFLAVHILIPIGCYELDFYSSLTKWISRSAYWYRYSWSLNRKDGRKNCRIDLGY